MFTNKIYCFGDGYAAGHIWPEWPQILAALLPEFQVNIIAAVGSGPEWLVTRLVQEAEHAKNSNILWQWPQSRRFDKLIEDSSWDAVINSDPVYSQNTHKACGQTWWLSSASQQPQVRQYHSEFIQTQQHQQRLINYHFLVEHTLKSLNCNYYFFNTVDQENFIKQGAFLNIRQQEIQPSPLVHFYYCTQILMPALNLQSKYTSRLEQLIKQQTWQAYDPDRTEIWQTINEKLIAPKR